MASNSSSRTTLPYIVTAVGIGLMAISEIYSYVRLMMFRAMLRAVGGQGTGFTGARHFYGGFGFGLPNILTMIALVIAIIGVVWMGLVLRNKTSANV